MPPFNKGLPPAAIKQLGAIVDALFDKIVQRFLGKTPPGRSVVITHDPHLTLPELFRASSLESGSRPSPEDLEALVGVAEGYIEAQRQLAKTRLVKVADSFVRDARAGKDVDFGEFLENNLAKVFQQVEVGVSRVVETEATTARNMGALPGIVNVNLDGGVDDPVVFFITIKDNLLCGECRRLHLLEDGRTPRLWLLSEVSHSYHLKGEDFPSISGGHPSCRCSLATCPLGWGFKDGILTYVAPGHKEIDKQRT